MYQKGMRSKKYPCSDDMFVIFHSNSCVDATGIIIGVENTFISICYIITINFHWALCPFFRLLLLHAISEHMDS